MTLSVIIPTWNEAAWLPRLLRYISTCGTVSEIIVADNSSHDGTVVVASHYGAHVVRGGRPAVARNRGGDVATGAVFVFIDADAIPSHAVLKRVVDIFRDPAVVAFHARTVPITRNLFIRSCYRLMNLFFSQLSAIGLAQGVGSFVAIRADVFRRLGGFDENVLVGEDADIYRRLRAYGRVIFDTSMVVYVSARRFTIEHTLPYCLKCVVWSLLRLAGSRRSVFQYKWREHSTSVADQENAMLANCIAYTSSGACHEKR